MLGEMVALGTGASARRTAGYVAVGIVLTACALLLRTGTLFGMAAAITAALAIPCFYLTFARPLIFPYGLYVLLIPFDDILAIGDANVTVTRILGIVSGIALLAWCFRKGTAVRPSWTVAVLVALYLWMALSVFWATDQSLAFEYLRQYAGLFLLFTALAVTPVTFKDFRVLLSIAVLGGIIASLYAIYVFHHNPLLAQQTAENQRLFVTPTGRPAPDPNAFADSLLLTTVALIMFVLRADNMAKKLFYGAGLAIVAVAILYSGSREAAIALVIVTLYLAYRSQYRIELSFVVAGLGAICVFVPSSLWLRFALGSQRSSIWAVAGEAFKHNWFHGYGVGSWVDAYNAYYLKVAQVFPNGWSSAPHNLIAQYAVELGFVGILIIASFFYFSFRELRHVSRDSEMWDYRVLMEAGLLALLVVAMFIGVFTYKYAWLTLALAAQLRTAALQLREAHAQPVHDDFPPIPRFHERAPALRPEPPSSGIERSDPAYRLR